MTIGIETRVAWSPQRGPDDRKLAGLEHKGVVEKIEGNSAFVNWRNRTESSWIRLEALRELRDDE